MISAEIITPCGKRVLVDSEFASLVCSISSHGRALTWSRQLQKTLYVHHVVMGGRPPKGLETDHINGNPLDNRRCNLRFVSRSINQLNSPTIRGSVPFKGVSKTSKPDKPFAAVIQYGGKSRWVGRFKTALEAARAYDVAVLKLEAELGCGPLIKNNV